MPKFSWKVCLVLLGCGAGALAQQPLDVHPLNGQEPPAQSGPITLEVAVTDKGGHAIPGLQQSDFTLLDNKQPVTIRSFAAHTLQDPGDDPETMVLLIDDVDTNFDVVSIARTQIENFLHADGGHLPLPVAIFMLTDDGLSQITPASSDGNAISTVLHQKAGSLHTIPRSAGFYGAEERTQVSLHGLERMTSYLSRAKGRKILVWLGPGWPIFDNPNVIISDQQQRGFFSAIVAFSAMLRAADITIDSVDPLGAGEAASVRNFTWESFTKPVTKPTKANPGNLALQVFATHTGGLVRWGSNDLAGEIHKCVENASAWYTITFDPQRSDSPDAWHDLQVKLDKPHLEVRTSNGYYAHP